jgi:hypothetical protein
LPQSAALAPAAGRPGAFLGLDIADMAAVLGPRFTTVSRPADLD